MGERARPARLRPFAAGKLRRLEHVAVLLLAAFVAAAALLALGFGGEAVWRRLATLSPGLVAGLLGLSLVNYGARGWRWLVFSSRLDLAVPAARGLLYFVAGFAFTATPGKVGEGLRLWLIERSHGYGYARLAPLLVGDRLSDLHGVVLLCLAGAAGFPSEPERTLLLSVADRDKAEAAELAVTAVAQGFSLLATPGTAAVCAARGAPVGIIDIREALTLVRAGRIGVVVNTPTRGHHVDGAGYVGILGARIVSRDITDLAVI